MSTQAREADSAPAPSVLLVDDDLDVREAVSALLTVGGFEVSSARSGMAALDLLRGGLRPAVIVTDIWMTPMDGLTLREHLKSDPALSEIPLVFMSAASPASVSNHEHFVRKPFDATMFVATVRRVMEASGASAQPTSASRAAGS